MKRLFAVAAALICATLLGGGLNTASAWYHVSFDFDAPWTEDYAPGWENSDYRHGPPPVGKMMEYTAGGVGGSGAMRLIADSTPVSTMFWAGVNPIDTWTYGMQKEFDPWVSVDYYDEGWDVGADLQCTGQMYAVPSWVNPYIGGSEDWTDIQFGARFNQPAPNDNYYFVACGESNPGWVDTGVSRKNGGWTNLKMQLSSTDGHVRFWVDGQYVGASWRNDYVDLISQGLYVMFEDPLSAWGEDKPSVIYDNFEFGSSAIPEPSTFALLGLGLVGLGYLRWRKK